MKKIYEDKAHAEIAQSVEHLHGKQEVTGSIPVLGSVNQEKKDPMSIFLTH